MLALSVCPTPAAPEMVGRAMFTGRPPAASALAAEIAGKLMPPALLAVSCARSVCPTSPATSVYAWPVARESDLQLSPEGSQRSHRYRKLLGSPAHVPCASVKV